MKQLFYLLSVMLLLIYPSSGMAQETSTVIWEEDFTGCTKIPTKGKNATYKYGGGYESYIPAIHFANLAEGISPELNLTNYSTFTVTVRLDGAYENLKLSFKKSNNKVIVYISEPKKKISANTDGSYTIPASSGDTSVHFTIKNNSSGNVYIDNLKLTGTRPSKTSPDISYDVDEVSTYADDFVQPVLQNPNSLQSFTYWSSDQSVATVDSNGEINIQGIGKTTISTIFHGSDDYGYQEASYVLNVKHRGPAGEVFYESFDGNHGSGGNAGDDYGEVSEEAVFDNEDMTDRNKRIIPAYKCINFDVQSNVKGKYTIKSIQGLCENATLTFRVKGYLSGEATLTLSASNANLSESEVAVKAGEWQDVCIQLTNIKEGCSITFTGGYLFLDDVSIVTYAPVSIGNYGYATLYYGDRALTVPDGMTAFTMKMEGEKVVESKRYEAGATIPKATAVVLKANKGDYKLYASGEDGVGDSSNELKGSDKEATTTGGGKYYRLSAHEGNVGFYWGANDGGAFTNGAHKAYLAISSSGAKKLRSGYPFHSNTTTSIEEIIDNEDDENAPCFNLSGQRVGTDYHGIVIRNGKKIFVK